MQGCRDGKCSVIVCIGILNHFFFLASNIAGPVGCQSSFCLMKIPMLLRLARAAYERAGAADRVIK